MGFYESISAWYDHIFPVDPAAVRFLAERARPGSRVLDLACGTGGHALELARLGRRVTGVDLDEAMIRLAQAKASGVPGVEFQVLDMRQAGRRLEAGFDLVFCIGNSIVHLDSEEAIAGVLADCRRLLDPRGALVVQIINYDRILSKRIVELPTLSCEEPWLRFVRRYDYEPGGTVVQFRTELSVREAGGERTLTNRVPLRILATARLERLMREAGFDRLELFGGFDGSPLGAESLPVVLCAYWK